MTVRKLVLLSSIFSLAFAGSELGLFIQPEHFPNPAYQFINNPLSKAKVELGRSLFYDPVVSRDSTISCASCHSPYNAFAHTDHDLSHGIDDNIGTRNAPALFNLAWQGGMMWDGSINHLDMQALGPITHPKEMDQDMKRLTIKLQSQKYYSKRFSEAYGDDKVTGERILKALSSFQLTLVSANAKYDRVQAGLEEFNTKEANGHTLFKKNCNSCHVAPLFSSYGFANNGLKPDATLNDLGKYGITEQPTDSLKFKIPSLRNLSYSYPYMHDGRYKKLHDVVNHYTKEIVQSSTLSTALQAPIIFTENEKTDLIAFLLTLDDKEFIFDKKHQFPVALLDR